MVYKPRNSEKDLFKKLKKCFPTEDDKICCIATQLGMAATMALYLSKIDGLIDHPPAVRYAIAVTAGNMRATLSPSKGDPVYCEELLNMTDEEYENIEKKLRIVIKNLYQNLMEEEAHKNDS